MNKIRKTKILPPLLLVVMALSMIACEKNSRDTKDSATLQIEGTIVKVVEPCRGNMILIEVDTPTHIGDSLDYLYPDSVFLSNAIGIPVNYRVVDGEIIPNYYVGGIDDRIMESGRHVKLKCRPSNDGDDTLFYYQAICPDIWEPVMIPRYIPTEIISIN
jgi:hypothetical protein